jgi:hypothetical protein
LLQYQSGGHHLAALDVPLGELAVFPPLATSD